jgi:imidazolonepropionase-like amidohydrolase
VVDAEFIALLRERGVPYSPTLTREVSTYVYEATPAFFSDPFFRAEADPTVVHELQNPSRQRGIQANPQAQQYKAALQVAKKNLQRLQDAGIPIVMGTDSGPPGRFQGYFEHMELDLMAEAGLTPLQILVSATSEAARSLKLKGVGSLEKGNWADFVVLSQSPLDDIRNIHGIESVWIAGNRVPVDKKMP